MGYYDNSGAATPWETVDTNLLGADQRFKLLPQLLALKGYVSHAIGKWSVNARIFCVCMAPAHAAAR